MESLSRSERRLAKRSNRTKIVASLAAAVLFFGGVGALWLSAREGSGGDGTGSGASGERDQDDISDRAPTSPSPQPKPTRSAQTGPTPINEGVAGITTFRGNASRTFYGRGPVPKTPEVLWRYPTIGNLCSVSDDGNGPREWCGTGWTGQPNVLEADGVTQVRFGAYDGAVHIVNGTTGEPVYRPFQTGDLIKGTVTSDPDGFPLLFTGSRDNLYRALALDRGPVPVELWSLDAASAPEPVWNNDWDGSALVIDDYLLEGGENSWFYVVKLNRGYDDAGAVTLAPEIRATIPGFDGLLFDELGDFEVSIENSVAFRDGVVYFSNSGGLVQGWDISRVLRGGKRFDRTFRFWTGEDTDASIVIDDVGKLYVATELERYSARGQAVGQLMKLDPATPDDPLLWSLPIPGRPPKVDGGIWSTPALHGPILYATTNTGRLLAVHRRTGEIIWEKEIAEPAWSSPIVVNDTLIVGDCAGVLHAYDVTEPLEEPQQELWTVALPGCIESTPALWKGWIYVGTRDGGVYGIADPKKR